MKIESGNTLRQCYCSIYYSFLFISRISFILCLILVKVMCVFFFCHLYKLFISQKNNKFNFKFYFILFLVTFISFEVMQKHVLVSVTYDNPGTKYMNSNFFAAFINLGFSLSTGGYA